MRSSEGAYYVQIDHVRAVAAFLVFFWHFAHVYIPFSHVPDLFLLSVCDEGHTGVALFMTLSGYLFARITDGKIINYQAFLWNRAVRLAPLLIVIFIYCSLYHDFTLRKLVTGLLFSQDWPAGAWSLTVELQFYALFPLLLILLRLHGPARFLALIPASVAVRAILWLHYGEAQSTAYWTMLGRFDQFVFGMAFFGLSRTPLIRTHCHALFILAVAGFAALWHGFSAAGGFYNMPSYPSGSPVWILLPTLEGLAFGCAIAAYDNFRIAPPAKISAALAHVGEVSYSLYLLHFLLITDFWQPVIMPMIGWAPRTFTQAALMAVAVFPLFVLIASASYRLIERPLLRYRTPYLRRGAGGLPPRRDLASVLAGAIADDDQPGRSRRPDAGPAVAAAAGAMQTAGAAIDGRGPRPGAAAAGPAAMGGVENQL